MKFLPETLFWRVYLIIISSLVLPLLFISWYALHLFKESYRNETAKQLFFSAELVAEKLASTPPDNKETIDELCKRLGSLISSRITIIKKDGVVLGDSDEAPHKMENHATRPEIIMALKEQRGISIRYSDTVKRQMMYLAIVRNIAGGDLIIRIAKPFSTIREVFHSFLQHIVIGALIVLLILLVPTFLIIRNIMLPLRKIDSYANALAKGSFKERLLPFNCKEIDDVVLAMNKMAAELEGSIHTITRQKEELEVMLSAMTEGIILVDVEEKILRINPTAASLFGLEPSEMAGKSIRQTIRNPNFQSFISATLNSNEIKEEELTIYGRPDRHLQLHGIPLKGNNGKMNAALIVFMDISRIKKLENVRKDFVANVSHELKTPITSLKGCIETLEPSMGDEKQSVMMKNLIEILRRNILRMEAIVNDLLTLARLEFDMERSLIEKKKEPLFNVIKMAVDYIKGMADKKHIQIKISVPDDLFVMVNTSLLQQAVINLLDNAIKYSPENTKVEIAAEKKPYEIEIKVIDEGHGIPAQHLDRIFERFYRIDKARSRALGGTGLGLSIVKNVALAHNGRVSVKSEVGKGSIFSIHLPIF